LVADDTTTHYVPAIEARAIPPFFVTRKTRSVVENRATADEEGNVSK
jgi:hypothetical protein